MNKLTKVLRRIEAYRDEMIDMQIRLCAIPAIAPSNGGEGENKKAEALIDFLKVSGFDSVDIIKAPDLDAEAGHRPNILAYRKGISSSKTIWMSCHMDVVPPGGLSLWQGNPFRAWVEAGKIFGRGVEDNQQDMVASLFAIRALHAEGIKSPFDLGMALVSDEETGSEKGIKHILAHANPFRKQDIIIVPDAGNKDGTMIEVAEKSILWLKFTTYGEQAHGSTPERGINSFRAAAFLITELNSLYKVFDHEDSLFDTPLSTFEPTKKEANVPNINTIPGEDIFYMDCRILPYYDLDTVKSEIEKRMRTVEYEFRVQISVEEVQRNPATPSTPSESPVVLALQKAIHDIYHLEAKPTGSGGGTVAGLLRRAGYEAAGWSRTDETAHQPNECCIIENMISDAKVFAHIFMQL